MTEEFAPPTTETTLAVVLGAGAYPLKPAWSNPVLGASARAVRDYLLSPDGFAMPAAHVLDLFDASGGPQEQLSRITAFLRAAPAGARDLILYYVGHGCFDQDDYCLGIRATERGQEFISTIESRKLARIIREGFARKRVYVVLDSCFAASAASDWMGDEIDLAVKKMSQPLPKQGTAFLAAASKYDVTRAPRAHQFTVFTGAVLGALADGVDRSQPGISLVELYDEVWERLQRGVSDEDGRPELHVPSRRDGDVSRLALFPNPAYRRGVEAERVRAEAKATALAEVAARAEVVARLRGPSSETPPVERCLPAGSETSPVEPSLPAGSRSARIAASQPTALQIQPATLTALVPDGAKAHLRWLAGVAVVIVASVLIAYLRSRSQDSMNPSADMGVAVGSAGGGVAADASIDAVAIDAVAIDAAPIDAAANDAVTSAAPVLVAALPTVDDRGCAVSGRYKVRIASHPQGAEVFINNTGCAAVGKTPWDGKLNAGGYTVTVKAPGYDLATVPLKVARVRETQEMFIPLVQKLELPKVDVFAAPIKETAKPKYGVLVVSADVADAEVYIDRIKHPDNTPTVINVAEGVHVIEARKAPGLSWAQTVDVKAGLQTRVRAELAAQMSGVIRVVSDAEGARAFLDGVDMGPVPVDIKDVAAGEHIVQVKAAGFHPAARTVLVVPGKSQLFAELVPRTGSP